MSLVRLPPRKQPLPDHHIILESKLADFPKEPHPWNSRFIEKAREAAESCGYALSVHGTLMRDIDLVAVAWTEDADDIWWFLGVFIARTGTFVESIEKKPHGRIGMTLKGGSGYGVDRGIDLSILPPGRSP